VTIIPKNEVSGKLGVKKNILQLIPIDHGLSFPDNF